MLRIDELHLERIDSASVLHFSTVSKTDEPVRSATCFAVERARSKGKLISFDPDLRFFALAR